MAHHFLYCSVSGLLWLVPLLLLLRGVARIGWEWLLLQV